MINVNKVTSELAKMPDQALQQFAAMHKADPYMLSLAVSESNRRKEMRSAAQANMAAAPQPKVADQEIAGMAAPAPMPESTGIGALPAGNMNFADGGIVAFADRGLVESGADAIYNMIMPSAESTEAEKAFYDRVRAGNLPPKPAVDPDAPMSYGEQMGNIGSAISNIPGAIGRGIVSGAKTLFSYPTFTPPAAQAQPTAQPAAPIAQAAPTAQPTVPPEKAPPRALDVTGRNLERELLKVPTIPRFGTAATPEAAFKIADKFSNLPYVEKTVKDFYEEEKARKNAQVAAYNANKPKDVVGTAYEASLKAEEANAPALQEQAKANAIVRAGLAMMAGTSPNAFSNIGKGALAGMDDYAESIKGFKQAAKERQKAMANLEMARHAEARQDFDAQQRYQDAADDHLASVRRYGIEATGNAMGERGKMAAHTFDTLVRDEAENRRLAVREAMTDRRQQYMSDRADAQSLANERLSLTASLASFMKQYSDLTKSPDPTARDQAAEIAPEIKRIRARLNMLGGLPAAAELEKPPAPAGTKIIRPDGTTKTF